MHDLEVTIRDVTASHEDRLSAAVAIRELFNTSAYSRGTQRLVDICLSFYLNDIAMKGFHFGATFEPGIWRHFRVSEIFEEKEPEKISTPHLRIACRLLFEADRHLESTDLFRHLVEREPIAENIIQAAYNYENVARRTKNLRLAEEAIDLISNKHRAVLSEDRYSAEIEHLLGHLYILKGRLSDDHTLSHETRGVHYLSRSCRADPSYTSCYVFSYAEYGDYLTSIDRGLDTLKERLYESLSEEDGEIVDLEIVFYLAYSLMAIGEFEQSKLLLRYFINATTRKALFEARDHARLFDVKLELKRRGLDNIQATTYQVLLDEVSALKFATPESAQIREENERYKLALKFLAQSNTGEVVDESSLKRASQAALDLLTSLVDFSPSLVSDVCILFGPTESKNLEGALSKVGRLLDDKWGVELKRINNVDDFSVQEIRRTSLATLWCQRDVPPPVSSDCPVIQTSVRSSERSGVVSFTTAADLCAIALARVAVLRFLYEDQYVYGIVPCTVSPATKFQHPIPSLEDLLL